MTTIDEDANDSAADLDQRRKALDELLGEHWDYTLRENPEFASMLGDRRWNDRLTDVSAEAHERRIASAAEYLARFRAIETWGFTDEETLNRELIIRELTDQLEDARFTEWQMPVNQMSGVHLDIPQLVTYLAFDSVRDYDDYIARLHRFPLLMQQTMAQMRGGMQRGLMPPRYLLEKVAAQSEQIAAVAVDASPFAAPLLRFTAVIGEAERERIRDEIHASIRERVAPAYVELVRFVRNEYAPRGRNEFGVWSLPDGEERYRNAVKRQTTTDLSPDEIHRIGLAEVARIEEEMRAIAASRGFDDLEDFNRHIEESPALKARSRQHIVEIYQKHIDEMYAELPKLFGRLPKAAVEITPVEEYRENEAAFAYYNPGAADGSRPGRVLVNTREATSRKIITMESTAYHEGVPGHHMQIAIAQELAGLPEFRKQGGHNAYVEGWALYSERLGKDVGFYRDPYSDYGRLQDEMLRSIRLVVDTGVHHERWSRDRVVQFFRDHSAIDEDEIQSETDRYIVWPGQALGYKIGQLKILDLRERSRRELGSAFDIRRFHDELLGAGSLPLDVLERRMVQWMERKRDSLST